MSLLRLYCPELVLAAWAVFAALGIDITPVALAALCLTCTIATMELIRRIRDHGR